MQNLNKKTVESYDLPKRSRFYQASIDIDFMKKRFDFSKLPVSNVIFICTFDPFRLGLSTYTFRERCDEAPELVLGDGTEKHFYNCTYTGDDQPEDLKRFYEYIRTGAVTSDLTERIDNAVQTGRKNERWKTMYMREKMLIYDAIKDYEDQLDEATARLDEVTAKAEEATAKAEEANARVEEANARVEEATARADKANARAEEADTNSDILRQQLIEAGLTPKV